MKTIFAIILGAALTLSSAASAQDRFSVNGKIDLVSNYVWRGLDQNSGFSVQPLLGMAWKGLSLSAWGSQSLTNSAERDVQELDINLSYSISGFSVTLTDYWWGGLHNPYGYYRKGPESNPIDGGHHFEATLAYRISDKIPLSLSWSTWLAGADLRTDRDRRCYSTHVSAAYEISCPAGIYLTPAIGFTPWKGYYNDRTAVTDISLKASKDIALSGRFSLPVFAQAIVSPVTDHVYLIAGAGLSF